MTWEDCLTVWLKARSTSPPTCEHVAYEDGRRLYIDISDLRLSGCPTEQQ